MTTEDKKISDLYQQARSIEPPSHLDDTILAASRDAVAQRSRAKSPFSGSWSMPASIAAVVIVAVIIVPIVMQEASQKDRTPVASIDTPMSPAAKREQHVPDEMRESKAKQITSSFDADKLDESVRTLQTPLRMTQPADSALMTEQEIPTATLAGAAALPASSSVSIEEDAINGSAESGRLMGQSYGIADSQQPETTSKKNLARPSLEKITQSADEWIKKIKELITANKLEQAKIEWQAFKQYYPDHPENKKLQDRLVSQP